MTKALFRSALTLFILFAVVFSLTVGAESAEKTFRFSNGISFSYPSEYQAEESNVDGLGKVVGLTNMSDPYEYTMMFTVSFMENQEDLAEILKLQEQLKDNPYWQEIEEKFEEEVKKDPELKGFMENTTIVQEKRGLPA